MQDLDEWKARWQSSQTGWHIDEAHPLLVEYAGDWERVLVPLCGATHDLGWLADSGHEVVGIEVSRIAAERVFEDRNEVPTAERRGDFELLCSGNITVAVGDMFALDPDIVGTFDAVWDRAALVAIVPATRRRYVEIVRSVAPDAEVLLAVFDYEPSLMDGPPHSVPAEEVRALYGEVELLREDDLGEQFAERGRLDADLSAGARFMRRLYRART